MAFCSYGKYAPEYAAAIGKWMLNNASACRLFFPQNIDAKHQWAPEYRDLTENNIAYEGLRKADDYGKYSLLGKILLLSVMDLSGLLVIQQPPC